MFGHGRPRIYLWVVAIGLSLTWLGSTPSLRAQEVAVATDEQLLQLELRIALGGGVAKQWQGALSLSAGDITLVRMLGLEPDTPASIHPVENRLVINERSPRVYDGCDISVRAPRDAKLIVELSAQGPQGTPQSIEIPLADLVAGDHRCPIDQEHNQLLVRRTPGDKLHITLERDSLVFDTGETLRFSVTPHQANLPSDTALKCKVRLLTSPGDAEVWSGEADFRMDRSGVSPTLGPFECVLPDSEGVYRCTVEIIQPPRLGVALVRSKPLLTRDMQFVVLGTTSPVVDVKPWETVLEIDPAHPGWLERLTRFTKLNAIPGFAKEQLGNKKATFEPLLNTTVVQLATGGWQAYPLPIKAIGQPHILEVEYPSDLPQTLGISIVEPNAAGLVTPLGIDSGVEVSTPPTTGVSRFVKHRLVFWPRTKTPLVLLTNRHAERVAMFGKLRVLAGPQHLPDNTSPVADAPRGRLLAAYYDRPLFAENFGAGEALDGSTGRTLDDWNTFYLGARRLIEQLKYAGYNGAVISVACEGSTLYPSQLLDPTPKYDMGPFFSNGQDPLRKDVLEMMFRMFDREGLQLAPAIQFSTPLVELEELKLREAEAIGVGLIGSDGKSWLAARGARRGLAPYYNPLDERVRLAMRRVVDELAERYAHHEAFAGVSLQLGPESYSQLPGDEWAYDDRTLDRFARDAKAVLPARDPSTYTQRVQEVKTTHRDAWHAWRAKQLASLYTATERDLVRRRGNARLFLAGGEMFNSETLLKLARPTLPSQANQRAAMMATGIDPELLRGETNIVLLRPQRQFAPGVLAARGAHLDINRAREIDEAFQVSSTSGVHLFHEPSTLQLPEFEAVSPFGANNTTLFLATQFAPSQAENRRRFAQAMAAGDPQTIVDGGWQLPLGQEDSAREFLAVYRDLPPRRFDAVEPEGESRPAVVCRRAVHEGETYLYMVNASAWPTKVRLELVDPDGGTLTALGGRTMPTSVSMDPRRDVREFTLGPYDLQAWRSTSGRAQVAHWEATPPAEALAAARTTVDQLRSRAIALRTVAPLQVLSNAKFEAAAKSASSPAAQEIAGWIHEVNPGLKFELDRADARDQQALHVTSTGPVAWLRSEPFAPPTTGRMSVWVWIKVKDPQQQPELRLAIEGRHRDLPYYRFASVGAGKGAPPLKSEWAPYLFQIDDLPTSELSDLRVGFDLMGKGDIWLDDVQVFDRYFHDHEQDELLKIIALADLYLAKRKGADCQRVVEGYWPRFLTEYVPLPPAPPVAPQPSIAEEKGLVEPKTEEAKPAPTVGERIWGWVPKWR